MALTNDFQNFTARWKEDMSEEDGKKLVRDAIAAGIFNDLGSGSNVDLCVIRKNFTTEYLRGYEYANVKGVREVNMHTARSCSTQHSIGKFFLSAEL